MKTETKFQGSPVDMEKYENEFIEYLKSGEHRKSPFILFKDWLIINNRDKKLKNILSDAADGYS